MSDPIFGDVSPRRRDAARRPRIDLEAMRTYFRRWRPRDTAWEVAQRAGLPVDTVASWFKVCRSVRPSSDNFYALAIAFGPGFVAAVWPDAPAYVVAAARDQEIEQLRAEIAERLGRLDQLEQS